MPLECQRLLNSAGLTTQSLRYVQCMAAKGFYKNQVLTEPRFSGTMQMELHR